jgi:biopolymer transport protein ExbB/TolQ
MSVVLIILIVVVVLVAVFAVGGYIANARRRDAEEKSLHARVEEADQNLAQAHAEDKGWERSALEAAAREAFAERHPGEQLRELLLVQVLDRPGMDEDQAVFHARTPAGQRTIRLGRRDGAWVAE